jgi:hypothetical protein
MDPVLFGKKPSGKKEKITPAVQTLTQKQMTITPVQ